LKVIHLISGGDSGGAKTHVHSLLEGLNKTIDATLVCFVRGPFSQEAEALGIPTVVIENRSFLAAARAVYRLIRREGFDLIHCHGSRGNLMGALLKLWTGLPTVSTVHSDYRLDYLGRPAARVIYGTANAAALRFLDYRIGVSEAMRRLLISRKFKPNRIFTIYNGMDFSVEPPRLDRAAYFARFGLKADESSVVVGLAARLDPVKDIPTLIRAFALAHREHDNLRLLIAGDGRELARLKALTAELGVGDVVCFAGWLTDMSEYFQAIDINTLSSISETFPYVLTEGARAHLPTVSSRVGGVPALIQHGRTGLLFEVGDYEALARHLSALAADPALRRRLGDALYEKARRDFSVEASCRRQLEIYDIIMSRSALGRGDRSGVLICGAYGHGNAGDDAILEAIIGELHGVDPAMPLTVLSRRPEETMNRYGVDAVYTFDLLRMRRAMKKTRVYLNGGGSLIQDVTSRRSLGYYLFTLWAARRLGARVIMYGCGIGPVNYPTDVKWVKRILNTSVDVITLREEDSLRQLESFGVTAPEILLSADPALTLPAADDAVVDDELRRRGMDPAGKYIGFALRDWKDFSAKTGEFAAAADYAYSRYGLEPIFLSINHRSDGEAALAVSRKLHGPWHLINEPLDSALTIGLMSRMAVLVSMRLHGLIFASGQGTPLIGVSYDPKVRAFLHYVGQNRVLDLGEMSGDGLIALIDDALADGREKSARAAKAAALAAVEKRNVEAITGLLES